MIFLNRRRLVIWLLKAYVKKWKRTIFVFFGLGLVFFFILYFLFSRISFISLLTTSRSIGVLGVYDKSNLPTDILSYVSHGLTSVDKQGRITPAAASTWKIEDDGKKYTFRIKNNLYFSDGTKLTSKEIDYNFQDVEVMKPNSNTIIFKLRESYSPFLVTVSKPIFKKGGKFIGIGNYKLSSLDLNGEFVDSLKVSKIREKESIYYQFYPTEDALKTALVLGEISETKNLTNLSFKDKTFDTFSNYTTRKETNTDKLVTLFYNTQDKVLSDKRLRQALAYATPNQFEQGKRNITPYPPGFWADSGDSLFFQQDFEHSKLLLEQSSASDSASLRLNIKSLSKYKPSAEKIRDEWRKIGIKSDIELVESLPSNFQIFLGEFFISKDPDQYSLWHSEQSNNITKIKNLRIDKLLEDGRQVVEPDKREKIYADFQKYLLDDSPASFLFFPYNYSVLKK